MFARGMRIFILTLLLLLCLAAVPAVAELEDYAGTWAPVSDLSGALNGMQVQIELRTDGSGSVLGDGKEVMSFRWGLSGFTCEDDDWELYYDGKFLCLKNNYVLYHYSFRRVMDAHGRNVRPDYTDSPYRGYWFGQGEGAAIRVALKGDGSGWIDMRSSYAKVSFQLTWQDDPNGVRIWLPDLPPVGAEGLLLCQNEDWLVEQNHLLMEVDDVSVELGKIAEFDTEERFLWSDYKDGTCILEGIVDDTLEELVLPETIEGRELRYIDGTLSKTMSGLKWIQLPDCVQSISYGAFRSCTALESIVIPKEVSSIYSDQFAEESKPTIITTSGSAAQAYAEQNNVSCLTVDQVFYSEKPDLQLIRMEMRADGSVDLSEGSLVAMHPAETYRWRFNPNGWTIYQEQLPGRDREIATVQYRDGMLWLSVLDEAEEGLRSMFVSDRMERFLDCCQRMGTDVVEETLGVWVPVEQPEGRYLTVCFSSRGNLTLCEYFLQKDRSESRLEWYPTEAGIDVEKDGSRMMTLAPPADGKLVGEFLDWGNLEFVRIKASGDYLSSEELEEQFHFQERRRSEQINACKGVWKSTTLDNYDFVYLYLFLAEDGTGAYRYANSTMHPLTWEPTGEGFCFTPAEGLNTLGLDAGVPVNVKFSELASDSAEWWSRYNGIVSLSREEMEWTPPKESSAIEGLSYELREDGCAVLTGYSGTGEELLLPEQLDGHMLIGIEENAIGQNYTLRRVVIPDCVEYIGADAFAHCSALEEVKLPAKLRSIGENAFLGCWQIEHLSIPEGVKEIGANAFSGCYSLMELNIPGNVEVIGANAFASCPLMEKLQLNEGLRVIGDWAFCGDDSLQEVVIPEGVTTVGEGAFSMCDALWKVVLPDSLITIGNTFDACAPTLTLWANAGSAAWRWAEYYGIPVKEISAGEALTAGPEAPSEDAEAPVGDAATRLDAFNWGDNGDGTVQLELYLSSETVVRVPELVSGAAVTSLGVESFARSTVTEVHLPEGVLAIGDRAFFECAELQKVTLPASLQSVGKFAFNNCPNLVLRVPVGSWAESYAAGKKLKFETY